MSRSRANLLGAGSIFVNGGRPACLGDQSKYTGVARQESEIALHAAFAASAAWKPQLSGRASYAAYLAQSQCKRPPSANVQPVRVQSLFKRQS
jgi:hypothetical protein